MPSCDCFFHHLPTCHRQWSYAASAQIPQAFVCVARVKENDAFTRVRMMKRGARMFRDKFKERLAPGSIWLIRDLFAKLFEFFNADDSDRFGDRFAPLLIAIRKIEFFEWHRARLFSRISECEQSEL